MANILPFPSSRNPSHQRSAYRRLRVPLDTRLVWLDFQAKRQAYFADPCDETERTMLEARDAWNDAHEAAHGSVA